MTSLHPRTDAVLRGEFPESRIAGLAQTLEMELVIQTNAAVYWKEKALKYWAELNKLAPAELPLDNPPD